MYATSFVFVIDVCMLMKQNNQLYNQNVIQYTIVYLHILQFLVSNNTYLRIITVLVVDATFMTF